MVAEAEEMRMGIGRLARLSGGHTRLNRLPFRPTNLSQLGLTSRTFNHLPDMLRSPHSIMLNIYSEISPYPSLPKRGFIPPFGKGRLGGIF